MLKQCWNYCVKIGKRFLADNCPIQAAGLSYTTLLSIVPLMTVSFTVLAAFPVFKGLGKQIQQMIFSNFVASSAQVIQQHLNTFMSQTAKLSIPGTFFLVITAILMIFSMEQAFNRIWQVKKHRNAIQAFLMYWAVLTLTPILIGLGLMMSSYLLSLSFVSGAADIPEVKAIFLISMPYIFTFLAFTLLYVAVPNCKVKISWALVGALIASILFELAKLAFTFYITHFPTYLLLYGALATIPIFLVWLYLSWLIILFGALVTAEIGLLSSKPEGNEM